MVAGPGRGSTRWYRAPVPFGVSIWELLILLVVLLLVFGASRLPEMGRSLGRGMREFKDAVTGVEDSEPEPRPTPPPAELPSAPSEPSATQRGGASVEESDRQAVS
jgi:sec-independent protein translocase protein TatA